MIVVRGVNLYPSAVEAIVATVPAIAEYRVLVERRGALAEITVEIECGDGDAALALERAFAVAFSLRIPVRRVPELPRFELKARRWVTAE